MRVFYRGFNLFNQFPHEKRIVDDFIDQYFEKCDNIVFAISYAIMSSGNILSYSGAGNDGYNHKATIQLDLAQPPIGIFCSDDHILILDSGGIILKVNVVALNVVNRVPNFYESDEIIKNIAVGSKITVAYTDKGNIYNVPEKLEHKISDVVDIKCGREHCLLLDKSGNLYSFGRGSRGQLGHGSLVDEVEPKLVEALAGLSIVAIATGGWHSCAISYAKDLYVWGWNGNGQLGLGDNSPAVMATPQLIDMDNDIGVLKVACGNRHTIVLLENQRLLGCGWNKYKQLTNGNVENINIFTYLYDFSGHFVSELQCGPWSSAVMCKQEETSH